MADPEGSSISLPVSWVGYDDVPIQFANQFLMQFQTGEIILAVGQITPPPVIGTPDEQREQLRHYPFVPVRVAGRYALTRQRLQELIDLLKDMADRYDRSMEGDA